MAKDTEHAKIAPSALHRILECPGSVRMCEGIPSKTTVYAQEGSIAHALGEVCILRQKSASDYLGWFGWINEKGATGIQEKVATELPGGLVLRIDENMTEAVQIYIDHVREIRRNAGKCVTQVEAKINMDWISKGMFGTVDHLLIEPVGTLYVDDYKHGAGVPVEIVEDETINPQLGCYGLGVLGKENNHQVENVQISIIQPRAPHADGPIRSHTMTVEELIIWGDEVLFPGIKKVYAPTAILEAGSWCRFCPALDRCPKARAQALETAGVMFDETIMPVEDKTVVIPDPKALSGEELSRVLQFAEMLEAWIKSIKEEAFDRHKKGRTDAPDDWKIVSGKATRKWGVEETEIQDTLSPYLRSDEMFEPVTIKSVARMEKTLEQTKLFKKEEIKEILQPIVSITRGESLVPVSDKRPALVKSVDSMFNQDEIDDMFK